MTPTPDAVKASAIEELLDRVRVTGSRKELGDDLVDRARAELSALRRGVSVEDARVAYENAFVESNSVDRRLFGWHARAHEAGLKAVLALVETGKGVKP